MFTTIHVLFWLTVGGLEAARLKFNFGNRNKDIEIQSYNRDTVGHKINWEIEKIEKRLNSKRLQKSEGQQHRAPRYLPKKMDNATTVTPTIGYISCQYCQPGQKSEPNGTNSTAPVKGCSITNLSGLPFTFTPEETACCDKHNECFIKCGNDFHSCEEEFRECLQENTPNGDGIWIAGMTYSLGCPLYLDNQTQNCKCVDDPNYTQPNIDLGLEWLPFNIQNITTPTSQAVEFWSTWWSFGPFVLLANVIIQKY